MAGIGDSPNLESIIFGFHVKLWEGMAICLHVVLEWVLGA